MIAAGMGSTSDLMKLVLALTFTAVGAQEQCERPNFIGMMTCVSPYVEKFFPLSGGPCKKERISKYCNYYAKIAECVIRKKISPACLKVGESEQLKQFGFACTVTDFQERCHNAPIIKTGDFVQTTTSTPEGPTIQTGDSQSKRQTNGAGGAAVTRGSLALLLAITIRLLFI